MEVHTSYSCMLINLIYYSHMLIMLINLIYYSHTVVLSVEEQAPSRKQPRLH